MTKRARGANGEGDARRGRWQDGTRGGEGKALEGRGSG